jgi:hypothetical protein
MPFRSGGLIVAEGGERIGRFLGAAEADRAAPVDLLQRYGRSHPTGTVTIPENC